MISEEMLDFAFEGVNVLALYKLVIREYNRCEVKRHYLKPFRSLGAIAQTLDMKPCTSIAATIVVPRTVALPVMGITSGRLIR